MYERWLVLKVWYTAGQTLSPLHTRIAYACESRSEKLKAIKIEMHWCGPRVVVLMDRMSHLFKIHETVSKTD